MNILKVLSLMECISGNEIGKLLGISRVVVREQINKLKHIGYTIKSSSKGYTLIKSGKLFNKYEIELNIKKHLNICKIIKYYKELDSTQITVKKLAEKNFEEGIVVVAEKQNKSYGRVKRVWDSNYGGLWFSMLLKPAIRPDESSKLALLLSIALNRVLEKKYKINSEIKWPNDVLVCGRKIAGIIIEMSAEQDIINWVVAGIGVNINNSLPKYLKDTAISLRKILNIEIDRAQFLSEFLIEFEDLYFDFQKNGFKRFLEEYNNKIAHKDKSVIVDSGHSIIIGKNLGIDTNGMLIVKTENKLEHIISGTVRLLS
ncbi:MAG: biotin--[acetyl-CoA-carboxylase] ligase [Endomicrobium sp.]|jgi:BirA family biotin operon repressor/biotin-[acetyl-CoA-carboxylase] ligase|nr:biotin--[acetyl-CoA-carboxylase] ligase [Endomicrobium sp.]